MSLLLFITVTGVFIEPTRMSTRAIFLSIFFCSLLIFESYYAALTALLAVVNADMPFANVADLISQTNFEIGSVSASAFEEVFKVTNSLRGNFVSLILSKILLLLPLVHQCFFFKLDIVLQRRESNCGRRSCRIRNGRPIGS